MIIRKRKQKHCFTEAKTGASTVYSQSQNTFNDRPDINDHPLAAKKCRQRKPSHQDIVESGSARKGGTGQIRESSTFQEPGAC